MSGTEPCRPEERIRVSRGDGRLILEGDVGGPEIVALERALALVEPGTGIVLELDGLDVVSGTGAVALVNLVRRLVESRGTVDIRGAPQILAHNLYRVGMLLPGSGVHLHSTREDEPYG